MALTYGPDTDWLKNVLAAGGRELLTAGRQIKLASPRLFHDEKRRGIRVIERWVLGLFRVDNFLELQDASYGLRLDQGWRPPSKHDLFRCTVDGRRCPVP